MVDVSEKAITARKASASCIVHLGKEIINLLAKNDNRAKKGPVFQTAILAGIMATKNTPQAIPLCHPLPLQKCTVDIEQVSDSQLKVVCHVKTEGKTGVEMEALHGASVAALTIYDMCKAYSHDIVISDLQLEQKTGGKRDFKRN